MPASSQPAGMRCDCVQSHRASKHFTLRMIISENRRHLSGSCAWGRRPIVLAAVVLFIASLILVGQGVWIHAKALLAQVLLERAFAASLETGRDTKPWSWADTWPVARIELPRLRKSAIALNGSSGQALAFGPGHMELTPEAGDIGTAVYSAHRDTHFSFVRDIGVGDEIRVTRRDGIISRFRVTHMSVVPFDATGIEPSAPGRQLVLATCWPLDGTTATPLRYLVHAQAMEPHSAGEVAAPRLTAPSGARGPAS
jgi:sortase A